jgi:SepF-like predicted cell division protein (DUF552 family)
MTFVAPFVVNNGRRAEVSFGSYSGQAGVQDADGEITVAFVAKIGDLKAVSSGMIDGEAVVVTKVARSERVPDMVVLTVTAVSPEPA